MKQSSVQKFIGLALLLLVACRPSAENSLDGIGDGIVTATKFARPIDRLNSIIAGIGQWESVDAQMVGYAGVESAQYRRYLELERLATLNELQTLSGHANTNVRVYAFLALLTKAPHLAREEAVKHLNDKAAFQYRDGCISLTSYVNIFFLQRCKALFPENKFQIIWNQVSIQFPPLEWERMENGFSESR
jgi:hypothetical protein